MREGSERNSFSRRDFLRGMAASGATFALPNILNIAFSERAYAITEVQESMSWEEGLAALRRDVFHADNETKAYYIESDRPGWRKPRDLGITSGTEADKRLDEEFFRHLLAAEKGLGAAKRAHTHAVASLVHEKHVPKDIKDMMAHNKNVALAAPPSVPDILLHIWTFKRCFETTDIEFQDMVLDPSGVWHVSFTGGIFADTVFDHLTLREEKIPAAIQQSGLPEGEQERVMDCIMNFDAHCVHQCNIPALSRLFEQYQTSSISADVWFAPAIIYQNMALDVQKRSAVLSYDERKAQRADIIRKAKELNVVLTFEPYEKTEG